MITESELTIPIILSPILFLFRMGLLSLLDFHLTSFPSSIESSCFNFWFCFQNVSLFHIFLYTVQKSELNFPRLVYIANNWKSVLLLSIQTHDTGIYLHLICKVCINVLVKVHFALNMGSSVWDQFCVSMHICSSAHTFHFQSTHIIDLLLLTWSFLLCCLDDNAPILIYWLLNWINEAIMSDLRSNFKDTTVFDVVLAKLIFETL